MAQTIFDCVVIGAGPAGAAAAYQLSKNGCSVLLLEKASLPRYKPCGGGVSPIVAQWFDFDFEPVISQKVTRARFTYNMQDEFEVDLPPGQPLWMVRRDEFDHYIVKQAQAQGTTLQDNTKATGIEFKDDHWQVSTPDGVIQGRYLIAADGARGPVARWLGFKQRPMTIGGAIETEPRLDIEEDETVYFDFGLLKKGYVWNFPKADGYSLGSGVFGKTKRKSRDLVQPLADYAQQFGVDTDATEQFGHPLALWNGNQTLHTQNAVLAGEAACVVDPFTAEGIRPSIWSGLRAADAITQALSGDVDALANYTHIVAEEWGSEMKCAQQIARAFYTAPKLSYQLGVRSPNGMALMTRVFAGEIKYADILDRAMKKLSFGLL